eukprot:scaffold1462_cov168-Ochromonas_danica.AAC.2
MKGIADAAKVVVHEIAAMSTPKGSSSRTFPSDKAKSNKNEDTNTSYGKNNGEASSSSSDEGKLTLAQISTELQRTEREVWEEMHEQTQAFYRAASASPLDRSPRCYGSIPLSSSNGESREHIHGAEEDDDDDDDDAELLQVHELDEDVVIPSSSTPLHWEEDIDN